MNKMLIIVLSISTLIFVGCSEKSINEPTTNSSKEELEKEDKYAIVIAKSIKDCKEHNIILDENRTNHFMRMSPLATIEKAAQNTAQTSKKFCQFFLEETSDEKIGQVDVFSTKIVASCEKFGIALNQEAIHNKVENLPFFVIKKGLAMKGNSSLEECQLMEKKYK